MCAGDAPAVWHQRGGGHTCRGGYGQAAGVRSFGIPCLWPSEGMVLGRCAGGDHPDADGGVSGPDSGQVRPIEGHGKDQRADGRGGKADPEKAQEGRGGAAGGVRLLEGGKEKEVGHFEFQRSGAFRQAPGASHGDCKGRGSAALYDLFGQDSGGYVRKAAL